MKSKASPSHVPMAIGMCLKTIPCLAIALSVLSSVPFKGDDGNIL